MMKKLFLTVQLVVVAIIGYSQVSVKVGYGPDHLSQIGDNDPEKFIQLHYHLRPIFSVGLGYRSFSNIKANRVLENTPIIAGVLFAGREFADIDGDEIYLGCWWRYKHFELGLAVGLAQYQARTELYLAQIDNPSNEELESEWYKKSYNSYFNFRAGLDLSYNIRLIDRLYLSPYGRYHRDFRPRSISFDLESMVTLDPLFANVPEIDEFNVDSKAFGVKRAIVVFGLALKYQL